MSFQGSPIGRSSHSEQLANDPRARRNSQIQTVPELDVGDGLFVNNRGSIQVKAAQRVATHSNAVTSHRAYVDPLFLSSYQTTSTIDITGSAADSITNLKTAVLAIEANFNSALAKTAEVVTDNSNKYNAALNALHDEVLVLRSLVQSLKNAHLMES